MRKIITIMVVALMGVTACKEDEQVNIKPVAAFGATLTTLEVGQEVSFIDMSFDEDGEVVKWQWDFGNGTSSEEKNPTIVYARAGDFKISLTVWDAQGVQNANSFDKLVTVKEKSLSNEQPEILWEYLVAGAGFQDASPAIDLQGNIITGFDGKDTRGLYNIVVLGKDGIEKWKYISGDVVRSTPTVADDGTFYIGSYDKKLYAFKADSSEPLASFGTGATVKYSAPVVDADGTVYYAGNKKLYAISAAPEMQKRWEFSLDNKDVNSTAIIGEDAVYVCANSGYLYAVKKQDGTQIWKTKFGTQSSAAPAMGEDGTIYLCGKNDKDGVVMAVNSDGTIRWQVSGTAAYDNSGVALDMNGHIYVGGLEGVMTCYNQTDGSVVWTFKTQKEIRCTPVITDNGNICFGDCAGYFYILNGEGKVVYKEIKLGEQIYSSPVIDSEGILYVCANTASSPAAGPGKIFALKTNAKGAQKTWSMRSGNAQRTGRIVK